MTYLNKLDKRTVLNSLVPQEHTVVIAIALPSTPLKTTQFINAFCSFFNCRAQQTDWGADRCQTIIETGDESYALSFLINIDWLCDAIWLEPLGNNQDVDALLQYLTTKNV
jgi:hypothetical protein